MLCQRCQSREATVFMTHCHMGSDGEGGQTRSESFCRECADVAHPEIAAKIEAGCRYCGEKGGGICPRCLTEFRRFLTSKGVAFPFEEGQMREDKEYVAKVMLELLNHMQQWGAEKRRGDAEGFDFPST